MTWVKKNLGVLVTISVLLLGGAVAWGTTVSQLSTAAAAVSKLQAETESAVGERATCRSDLRVVETRQQALVESMRDVITAVAELRTITARLEALASWASRPQ